MERAMWRMTNRCASALVVAAGLLLTGSQRANAQQPTIKRTDLLKSDLAGLEGKEMNIWTAGIAPGDANGQTSTSHAAVRHRARRLRRPGGRGQAAADL